MKTLAIMQPYLFPYISYFQLLHAADLFVIHDDVQYIKQGWINRNNILLNGQKHLFSFSLKKDSAYALISNRAFSDEFPKEQHRFFRLLQSAYAKAPFYNECRMLLEDIFSVEVRELVPFITQSLRKIADYLQMTTPIVLSSELEKDDSLHGEARVIHINQHLGASRYINPIGGISLYSGEHFKEAGIQLRFLKPREIVYQQFNHPFVPWLSIVDLLMFNPIEQMQHHLNAYELLEA